MLSCSAFTTSNESHSTYINDAAAYQTLEIHDLQPIEIFNIFTNDMAFDSSNIVPSQEQLQLSALWKQTFRDGVLYVDNGYFVIGDLAAYSLPDGDIIEFHKLVEFANKLIRYKMITPSNTESGFEAIEITQETFDSMLRDTPSSLPPVVYIEPHECGYPSLNVGAMCFDNYNELEEYYDMCVQVSIISPDFDPYLATAGYWVGKVREGGDWDYKSQPGFSPYDKMFCCSYGGLTKQHRTSEWLGNYNYGYTGSFLFSLGILHFGSSAVAGFDPADEEDWPAIDEGYYDSPMQS